VKEQQGPKKRQGDIDPREKRATSWAKLKDGAATVDPSWKISLRTLPKGGFAKRIPESEGHQTGPLFTSGIAGTLYKGSQQ